MRETDILLERFLRAIKRPDEKDEFRDIFDLLESTGRNDPVANFVRLACCNLLGIDTPKLTAEEFAQCSTFATSVADLLPSISSVEGIPGGQSPLSKNESSIRELFDASSRFIDEMDDLSGSMFAVPLAFLIRRLIIGARVSGISGCTLSTVQAEKLSRLARTALKREPEQSIETEIALFEGDGLY